MVHIGDLPSRKELDKLETTTITTVIYNKQKNKNMKTHFFNFIKLAAYIVPLFMLLINAWEQLSYGEGLASRAIGITSLISIPLLTWLLVQLNKKPKV